MLQLFFLLTITGLFLYLFHWKLVTLISAVFFYYVWKDWQSGAQRPTLYYQSSSPLCEKVTHACKILTEKYSPPVLWGKLGHVHTLLYGVCGRIGITESVTRDRRSVVAADGTTIYYDVFHPNDDDDYSHIILVCPGIGNHSGAKYLQSLVHHATSNGHCVVIMNHVGALGQPLTGNRIFSYGGTGDLALTYEQLKLEFPNSKFIGVGFSLGGNILLKFLGECPERQNDFVCAISICQGYDAVKALLTHKSSWNSFYNLGITKGIKRIIKQHHHQLLPRDTIKVEQTNTFLMKFIDLLSIVTSLVLSNHQLENDGSSSYDRDYDELVASRNSNGFSLDQRSCEPVDMNGFNTAQIMQQVDECYTRRVMGFRSVHELYRWSSCVVLMHKIRTLPMLLINARDDPLVREELLSIPFDYTKFNPNAIFLCTEYGGHLGFFEGGLVIPDRMSWVDRVIVEYATTILQYSN